MTHSVQFASASCSATLVNLSKPRKGRSGDIPIDRRAILRLSVGAIAALSGWRCAAAASAVSMPIEQLYSVLPQAMRAGRAAPFRQRYDMLAPAIDAAFDLDEILKNSIGPNWATLSAGDRAALRDAFRRYTIATYVANFDNYSGQRFEVRPDLQAVGSDQVVQTRIISGSGESHRLDYVMRQSGGAWRVVDVLADGSVSRVATQRSEIRSVFASGGSPALLARLQNKIRELSGAQMQ